MGELYNRFAELKKRNKIDWFMDEMGLVKFDYNGKTYEIFFPRKRANRYTIIHCQNNVIQWEQCPVLPHLAGRRYGIRQPFMSIAPSKECVRIVVILGKPNSITGLDEGIFRSVHKYDESYINVMSEARFKEL